MAKTTKTMKLTFLNGEKKKISITLGDAVDNLTADVSVNVFAVAFKPLV